MTIGIPQGSVLEGLLFLVYINELTRISESLFMVLFAVDICIFLTNCNHFTLIRMFNEELCIVLEWLNSNRLTLTIDKTVCVNFPLVPFLKMIPSSN